MGAQGEAVLSFRSVGFGPVEAPLLQEVSFELLQGEHMAILGGPLTGKTLLLGLAAGIVKPARGHIMYAERGLRPYPGVVLDTVSLHDDLTVRGNLRWFGRLFGLFGRMLRNRIETLAEDLDLAAIIDSPVARLGQLDLRRADLARALIHAPEVLLLDEYAWRRTPEDTRALLAPLLASSASRDLAILRAARQMDDIATDRYLLLRGGRADIVAATSNAVDSPSYIDPPEKEIDMPDPGAPPDSDPPSAS